jgi:hypothetical protein
MSAPPPPWNHPPSNSQSNPIILMDSPPHPSFETPPPPIYRPPPPTFQQPPAHPSALYPPPPPYPPPPSIPHPDDIQAQQYFDQQCAAAAFSPNTVRMHPDFSQPCNAMSLFDIAPPSGPPPSNVCEPPPAFAPPPMQRIDVDEHHATPLKAPAVNGMLDSPGITGYSPFIFGYSNGGCVHICRLCDVRH